ncbi:hypothetical protein [Mycobacteroides abscessus]|uniref:hypothetical protein n=1 Tax=Mycobacteroides abscessus TaxID=36809 RepID=UPI0027DD795E|nr:hypothetical protein [Mycobacteroides abscessus]
MPKPEFVLVRAPPMKLSLGSESGWATWLGIGFGVGTPGAPGSAVARAAVCAIAATASTATTATAISPAALRARTLRRDGGAGVAAGCCMAVRAQTRRQVITHTAVCAMAAILRTTIVAHCPDSAAVQRPGRGWLSSRYGCAVTESTRWLTVSQSVMKLAEKTGMDAVGALTMVHAPL